MNTATESIIGGEYLASLLLGELLKAAQPFPDFSAAMGRYMDPFLE
jgi:hypothetical protein